MDILVKYSKYMSAVASWGIIDNQSWRANQCPLLFNGDYTAKNNFYSNVDNLQLINK